MMVDKDHRPPPHSFYGDNYERGLDPWNKDAFPDELKHGAPRQEGPRGEGWHLLDAYGNSIGFTLDGTEVKEQKSEKRIRDGRTAAKTDSA